MRRRCEGRSRGCGRYTSNTRSHGGVLVLWTIGHSNHTPERLLELLALHGIEVVIDVRSSPYSRFNPQFNREELAKTLNQRLRYAWMGDVLGGRPPDASYYDEAGHVLYGRLSRTEEFRRGLETLERNIERYRMALLCSEAEPGECHRHLLVCRCLRDRGMPAGDIQHILGDGSLRSEAAMPAQARLLEDAWRSVHPILASAGRSGPARE